MSVTMKEVEHIAALARLQFTQKEKETFLQQFNTILSYMEQLNSVDTSSVEPLSQVNEMHTAFRPDIVTPSLPREKALMNAPENTGEHFTVPKVIGDK